MKTYTKRQFEGNHLAWSNPKEVGQVSLEDETVALLNAQFVNSGIDYVAISEAKAAAIPPVAKAPDVTPIPATGAATPTA